MSVDEEGSTDIAKALGCIVLAVVAFIGLVVLIAHHWR
jgi:hypothetical protein